MKWRILLVVALSAIGGSAWAEGCNTELKPTDGYKELSEKLGCLSAKVEALHQVGDASSIKLVPGAPADPKSCVKSASMPRAAEFIFQPGFRLCREDGSVWFRVVTTSADQAPGYTYANSVKYTVDGDDEAKVCRQDSAKCELINEEGGEVYRLQVDTRATDGPEKKKVNVMVGMLSRAAARKTHGK